MRVLVVSQYFWPEGFRINDVVRTLVEKGVEVDVLTGQPNYPEGVTINGYSAWGCRTEIWEGANIFRVPLAPRGPGGAVRLILNYLSFVATGLTVGAGLLRKRQYDVVFAYGVSPILLVIPAIFIAWLKKRKLIVWVQDLWPESLAATGYVRSSRVLKVVEQVVRWIYRHTDLLLVQSRAFVPPVAALAPGKEVVYYPNSVEPAFCEPPSPGVTLPIVPALDEGFAVLFAGNVGAAQAVEVIVAAAEMLLPYPEIRFIVMGQGSRWNWMQEQVLARGLINLHLPGRFPVNTMPGLMQKAAALLVTLADEPIFAQTVPSKVQAYMAAGRPIIACLNGEGARLVIEAGAGLGVPAEDANALVEAVLKLYKMPKEARETLGQQGRRYFAAHFDHNQLVDDLIGHFNAMTATTKETA